MGKHRVAGLSSHPRLDSRSLASRPRARARPEATTADSYSPGYEPALAGDGDLTTIWHTEFVGASPGYPHELVVDLGSLRDVEGLLYVPRQDSSNGRVRDYRDPDLYRRPILERTASLAAAGKMTQRLNMCRSPAPPARYVQLRGLSEVEGRPFMSAAEVSVETKPVPRTIRPNLPLDTVSFAMQSK